MGLTAWVVTVSKGVGSIDSKKVRNASRIPPVYGLRAAMPCKKFSRKVYAYNIAN